MANVLDYLAWRGDIHFSQLGLNNVDALIFSVLSYIRYDGIVSEDLQLAAPLDTVVKTILSMPEPVKRCLQEKDLQLLEAVANSPRYCRVKITFYRNVFDPREEIQFAAVTFLLEDGTAFLAFRGTDNTLVGWKEDFNMSYQTSIPAQRLAQEYVQRFAAATRMKFWLGGHSKGGNLAVFAGAKCGAAIQPRILEVFNFDGPGFMQTMLEEPGYQQLLPRMQTFLPQFSVFGLLLEQDGIQRAVCSDGMGIMQHDPYTWQVSGKEFVYAEDVTESSRFLDKTLTTWLEGLSNEDRGEFCDAIFGLLMLENASQPKDVLRPQNVFAALKTIRLEEAKRRKMRTVLQNLLESAKTVRNESGTQTEE